MNPRYVGTLVKVGMNKKNFKPLVKDIKARYYAKFRGGGFLRTPLRSRVQAGLGRRGGRPQQMSLAPLMW